MRFYTHEKPVYIASGPGGVSRHLNAFMNLLRPEARILDLGCGGGRDSEAMLARGFDVDPTDGSFAIAQVAEARLNRRVRVLRFDELDAIDAYDAIWAHASLLHVPRSSLPHILGLVFQALKPGGFHLANYKAGGVEGRDRAGRYFNYPTADHLRAAYRLSGAWEILSVDEYEGGGFDGGQGPWVVLTARRPV